MLPQAAELSDTAISLNVMSKSYGLPGLRIGWLATRDRRAAGASGAPQALHDDRQLGPERVPRDDGACRRSSGSRPATARSSRPTCRCWTRSSRGTPIASTGHRPRAAACASRGCAAAGRRAVLPAAGSAGRGDLLPGEIYASALGDVPREHFRIGVGRHGTAEALAAFESSWRRRADRSANRLRG